MRNSARTLLLACLGAVSSLAQIRLTFQDALAHATKNNPQIAAAQSRIQSAQGLRVQAGLAPNPRFVAQFENYRAWEQPSFSYANSPDDYLYVGQLIERGGKRQRRVDAAEATIQRVLLERDLLGRQIASRVAAAYWTAASAERARGLWDQQVETYVGLVTYNENRLREGVVAEADVLRARVERDKARLSAANAAQEATRARITLYREMGQAEFPAVELDDPATAPPNVIIPVEALILQTRYELQVARQNVLEAEARLALQRANAKVDPDVSAGYKRTSGFDTVYAAVSVPLAIRNRNQGNIASAEADVHTAESSLRAAENVVRAEVAAARQEYEARQQLLSTGLPAIRQEAEETVRIARAAYREGGIDLLRLLDAERSRLDVEVLYYQTLSQFQQSVVGLQTAIGQTPMADTSTNPPMNPQPPGARP